MCKDLPQTKERKTQQKACLDPAFPSSAHLLPFPSRFFQHGPSSLTSSSPLNLLESGVDSRKMLKSTGNAVLSHLGSEQHPRSATDRFLSSPRLLGNRSSLSFLRCPGWLFLTSLEWVSAVSLTHNVSASPALVPCSPNSIQSLVELMQDCTSPYRSTQRHPSVCPRLWPSPPTPNSWIHNLTVSPWVSESHLECKTELFIFAATPRLSTLFLL